MKNRMICAVGILLCLLSCAKENVPGEVELEGISFRESEITLELGASSELEVVLVPSGASADIVWSSSDASIVSVEDGKITALAEGEAEVKAASGRFLATCNVKVVDSRIHIDVGYYYFSDGSVSDMIMDGKDVVGMIFGYDESSGICRIVSLNQGLYEWSLVYEDCGASDSGDGKKNTDAVQGMENWQENYPAFAWIEENGVQGIDWYMPSKKEMKELFAAASGLRISDTQTGEGFISDWGDDTDMPDYGNSKYQTNRTRFNQKMIDAGGARISGFYCTSTEGSEMDVWLLNFNFGRTYISGKAFERNVRAVAQVEVKK